MINGQRVRQLLKERGQRQRDLADFVGIDTTNMGKYLNGRIDPRSDVVEKIAIFFGLPIDAIWLHSSNALDDGALAEERIDYSPRHAWGREIPITMRVDTDSATSRIEESLGVIRRPLADASAFGIILSGKSMAPALPNGSRLLISPAAGFRNDRLHLIRFRDGRSLVRQVRSNDGGYLLLPYNNQFPPTFVQADEIENISLVVAVDLPG